MRRECCAEVAHVVIENTALLGGLVLGGALLLERRAPEPADGAVVRPMGAGAPAAADQRWRTGGRAAADDDEPRLCECYPDEALGLASCRPPRPTCQPSAARSGPLLPAHCCVCGGAPRP